MQYIGSEARLRNAYVDQLVASTIEATGSLEMPSEMYGQTATVEDLLANAYAPDVHNGVVLLDQATVAESVPIVPLRDGEKVRLSLDFATQTEGQRHAALVSAEKLFAGAKPEKLVDGIVRQLRRNAKGEGLAQEHVIHKGAAAMTTSLSTIFSKQVALETANVFGMQGQFAIGQLLGRAALFVPIKKSGGDVPIVVHELEHLVQKLANPLHVYYSQRDIDDRGLTTELQAYFAGAEATPEGAENIQTQVESIRKALNGNGRQKFRPHPDFFSLALKSGITEGAMIHGGFDFMMYARAMKQHRAPTTNNPFIKQ